MALHSSLLPSREKCRSSSNLWIYVWVAAFLVYLSLMLPQYSNYVFGFDCFYYLGRAKKVLEIPFSIFEPDYARRFHPLAFLYLAGNFKIFGLNPFAFGAFNLGVHIASSFLLTRLMMVLGASRRASFISAILFLFLSSQWCVTSDIPQFMRLGSTACMLVSVIFFTRFFGSGQSRDWAFSFLFFLMGLGFNEDAVTVPLLLTGLIFLRPKGLKKWLPIMPFYIIVGIYILLSIAIGSAQGGGLNPGLHVGMRLLFLVREFLQALFIPRQALVDFGPFPFWNRLIPGILIGFFMFTVLLQAYKKQNMNFRSKTYFVVYFALAWIFITALPYSAREGGWVWQNRYLYIPGMGVAMLSGQWFDNLLDYFSSDFSKRWISTAGKSAVLAVMFYTLALNAATNKMMGYHSRDPFRIASTEEVRQLFSLVYEMRKITPSLDREDMLVMENSPLETARIREMLPFFYFLEKIPDKIIKSPEALNQQKDIPGRIFNVQWVPLTEYTIKQQS